MSISWKLIIETRHMKSWLSSDFILDSIAMMVYANQASYNYLIYRNAEDTVLSGNFANAKFNMHASACIGHCSLAC